MLLFEDGKGIKKKDDEVKESIFMWFTDNRRVSNMVRSEDKEKMQELSMVYKRAEFLIEIFEQMCHETNNIIATLYKGPTGKDIGSEENIKYQGVIINDLIHSSH